MKVVVGLGNPGKRYQSTPHNVGFEVVEKLAEAMDSGLKRRIRFKARTAKVKASGEDILLVMPLTFMNNSGSAVSSILRYYREDASSLIVAVDDADLESGAIRVRGKGGSGGHRGVQSIVDCIGTADFARVRLGVGRGRSGGNLVDRVLTRLGSAERKVMDDTVAQAADAVMAIVVRGVDAAMNEFNGSGTKE